MWQTEINALRQRQNRRHFADNIFKCNFMNENVWIPLRIPLKFVPKGPINNTTALVQIMAWRRPGAEPLSEPLLVFLPTHICVTRPQWVKWNDKMNKSFSLKKYFTTEIQCFFINKQTSLTENINGLVQERRNSSVLAMELHLSCINPSIWE